MDHREPTPSPREFAAWGLLVLAGLAALLVLIEGGRTILARGYQVVPLTPNAVAALQAPAFFAAAVAAPIVVFVLLPLQRWGGAQEHRGRLALALTAVLTSFLGVVWLIRLNLVGFASLWRRTTRLGDLEIPTALVENRVWSGNIAVLLAVALIGLGLHALFVRVILRRPVRPMPLGLTATAVVVLGTVGVLAVLPTHIFADDPDTGSILVARWLDDATLRAPIPRLADPADARGWTLAETARDQGYLTLVSIDGRVGRRRAPDWKDGVSRVLRGVDEPLRIERTVAALAAVKRPVFAYVEVSTPEALESLRGAREGAVAVVLCAPDSVLAEAEVAVRARSIEPLLEHVAEELH